MSERILDAFNRHRRFPVEGFYCRHERHVIYWKVLKDGTVGVVTILHERMHLIERLKDDLKR